jgi:hypothetical protein
MSRIWEQCINSVDLCKEIGCDSLFCDRQIGIGVMLVKNGEWIGYITDYVNILGHDYIINKIEIYKDPDLSYKLTQKYMGKIIIPCESIDRMDS